jgi:hypothetical protein
MGTIKRVKATAIKDGRLVVGVTGMEKWNQPDDSGKSPEEPREDGHFDVEGHTWTDVNLQFRLDLTKSEDRKIWLRDFKEWLIDVAGIWKDCFSWKRKWFNLDLIFGFTKDTVGTLGTTKVYWAVVISSLDVFKSELAADIAHETLEAERPERDRELDFMSTTPEYRAWLEKLWLLHDRTYEQMDYRRALGELRKKALSAGDGIYVDRDDKSIIIVDNEVMKFDMKSGYSDKAILDIVRLWAQRVMGLDVAVVDSRDLLKTRGYVKIKASLAEVEAGKRGGEYGG